MRGRRPILSTLESEFNNIVTLATRIFGLITTANNCTQYLSLTRVKDGQRATRIPRSTYLKQAHKLHDGRNGSPDLKTYISPCISLSQNILFLFIYGQCLLQLWLL